MSKEIWKDVPNYEGYYEVSSRGRLRTVSRTVVDSIGRTRKLKSIVVKPSTSPNGYMVKSFYKDGKSTTKTIHRIVAITFLDEVDGKPCVNHINGIKTDNRVENLEFCSYSDNTMHGIKNGLIKFKRGANHHLSKKVQQIDMNTLEVINTFGSTIEAYRETGVNSANLGQVCMGKKRQAGGYFWKYEK